MLAIWHSHTFTYRSTQNDWTANLPVSRWPALLNQSHPDTDTVLLISGSVYVFYFFLGGSNLIYHYALLFFNGSWSSAKPTPTQSMSTGTPRSTTPASGARMKWPRCSTLLYTHTQMLSLYFTIISLLPLLVRDGHCSLFLWSSSVSNLCTLHCLTTFSFRTWWPVVPRCVYAIGMDKHLWIKPSLT